jgi:hypothetical protein
MNFLFSLYVEFEKRWTVTFDDDYRVSMIHWSCVTLWLFHKSVISQSQESYVTWCTFADLKRKGNFQSTHIASKIVPMSNKMTLSLATLPVELVYRILDNLDELTIHLSLYNTCSRLNTIINTYHQYRVNWSFILKFDFLSFQRSYELDHTRR